MHCYSLLLELTHYYWHCYPQLLIAVIVTCIALNVCFYLFLFLLVVFVALFATLLLRFVITDTSILAVLLLPLGRRSWF